MDGIFLFLGNLVKDYSPRNWIHLVWSIKLGQKTGSNLSLLLKTVLGRDYLEWRQDARSSKQVLWSDHEDIIEICLKRFHSSQELAALHYLLKIGSTSRIRKGEKKANILAKQQRANMVHQVVSYMLTHLNLTTTLEEGVRERSKGWKSLTLSSGVGKIKTQILQYLNIIIVSLF